MLARAGLFSCTSMHVCLVARARWRWMGLLTAQPTRARDRQNVTQTETLGERVGSASRGTCASLLGWHIDLPQRHARARQGCVCQDHVLWRNRKRDPKQGASRRQRKSAPRHIPEGCPGPLLYARCCGGARSLVWRAAWCCGGRRACWPRPRRAPAQRRRRRAAAGGPAVVGAREHARTQGPGRMAHARARAPLARDGCGKWCGHR